MIRRNPDNSYGAPLNSGKPDKPGYTAQNVSDGIEAASLVLISQVETYLAFVADLATL